MALGRRGQAILDKIAAQLERHSREIEGEDRPETITFVVRLNAGGWPHRTLYRPEYSDDQDSEPKKRRTAA